MRVATPARIGELPSLGRAERAAALLAEHEPALRRTARRFAPTPEDAEDALQRAAEILLRKGPDLDPPRLRAWMHVVVRREAFAVGRERRRAVSTCPASGAGTVEIPSPAPGPGATVEARERVAEAARNLGGLKPQERRALALQAAGCSYAEIQAITGWTYTKVNRCLAEGRAALRRLEPLAPPL